VSLFVLSSKIEDRGKVEVANSSISIIHILQCPLKIIIKFPVKFNVFCHD
jgi:hypothetical protein